MDVFVGRAPEPATVCGRCNNPVEALPAVSCAACGRPRPRCGGCAVAWQQVGNATRLGDVQHYCRSCGPT